MVHFMYKKLSMPKNIDYKVLDKRIEFELNKEGSKIQYFNVSSNYVDDLISSFGEYAKHFHTSFVNIQANVPPHKIGRAHVWTPVT